MRLHDPISLQKGILWEEAKGKLRAIVAAEGSLIDSKPLGDREFSFKKISKAVEAFIKDFEGKGYQE